MVTKHSAVVYLLACAVSATCTEGADRCSGVPAEADIALRGAVTDLLQDHARTLTDWRGRPVHIGTSLSCRDAVTGDVDGNGEPDIVAVFSADDRSVGAVLVSAFAISGEWRSSVVEILPVVERLSLAPPGEYHRNPAVRRDLRPGERLTINGRQPGVAIDVGSGGCLVFSLSDHRWLFTETACPTS